MPRPPAKPPECMRAPPPTKRVCSPMPKLFPKFMWKPVRLWRKLGCKLFLHESHIGSRRWPWPHRDYCISCGDWLERETWYW